MLTRSNRAKFVVVHIDSNVVRIQGYNKLTEKVLSIPVYRLRYKALLTEFLGTVFTVRHQMPIVNKMHSAIAEYVDQDTNHDTLLFLEYILASEPHMIQIKKATLHKSNDLGMSLLLRVGRV